MQRPQPLPLAMDDEAFSAELRGDLQARREIEGAALAVFAELGMYDGADKRRLRVVSRIATSWQAGRRQPLNLVNAGLDAACL